MAYDWTTDSQSPQLGKLEIVVVLNLGQVLIATCVEKKCDIQGKRH